MSRGTLEIAMILIGTLALLTIGLVVLADWSAAERMRRLLDRQTASDRAHGDVIEIPHDARRNNR